MKKHILHLTEDRTLKLGEIKGILVALADGEITGVTEKLDGLGLTFTVGSNGTPLVARSPSDVKAGGMDGIALRAKYLGRGAVESAFVEAYSALADAVTKAPPGAFQAPDGSRVWYAAEVVSPKFSNVVRYDEPAIVLHAVIGSASGLEAARSLAEALGGVFRGPRTVRLGMMFDRGSLERATWVIDTMGDPELTLQEVLRSRARRDLSRVGVAGPNTLDAAAGRLSEAPGCASIQQLKSKVPARAVELLKRSHEWNEKQLRMLETAIHDFAVDRLRDVTPSFVKDPVAEASRIRGELTRAKALLETSEDPRAVLTLRRHMDKLRSFERVTTAVEGVVFEWSGRTYKLTGNFAPVNAILGLMKYGLERPI